MNVRLCTRLKDLRSDQFTRAVMFYHSCVMVYKSVFVLILSLCTCHSQLLADRLFPNLAASTREITNTLTNHSLFKFLTKTAGDVFADTVYSITRIPVAVVRAIGSIEVPSIINVRNNVDMDRILAEYASGLANEDATLSVDKLIVKYGHPVEKHEVITEDGYVLTMFRIPGNGSVVFLMHGLLGSADDYVIAGPESSLACLLANDGYDVWLGNARGNKHSRRHISLAPSEALFWDFSWHEIGNYDLPAMIDYTLNTTDKKSLQYIGHSQGTTSFFVMGSQRPEYNAKIDLMIALSPVSYMSHQRSPPVRLMAPGTSIIDTTLKSFGVYEILPDSQIFRILRRLMCGVGPLSQVLCSNALLLTVGFGFSELNVTNLPVIYGHVPSGASVKQLAHFGQEILSGEFRQYDYGPKENKRKYGSVTPPNYPVEKISAPVSLFYSNDDWMSHPEDVDKLYKRLVNCIDIYKIPHEQFNHLDFIWAKNFKSIIFKRVKKLLKAFT
ncbi:lipase 3-like [Galleria mellonella]|uniref:Lipase 3-like n=1 Tax=Galleria mellonella TaxID=7137 RepID=A0A6J1X809_GALME|nr:lipase 3-like [Galleria mellonella]